MKSKKRVKRKVDKTEEQIKILKKSNELLKNRINQLRAELSEERKIRVKHPFLTDKEIDSALGIVHVGKNGNLVRLSVKYLEKALKILRIMEKEEIDIFVTKDFPCVLGSYDSEREEIAGIIIAPRIEGDD